MHDEFTDATALCLAANGIKTYVFPQLAPVPELSYAVRTLGTIAGVVITASHNPREYNGYKVYWEDGAQTHILMRLQRLSLRLSQVMIRR